MDDLGMEDLGLHLDLTALPLPIGSWGPVLKSLTDGDRRVVVQDAAGNSFVIVSEARFQNLVSIERGAAPRSTDDPPHLTERERQVLQLSGSGHPSTSVAESLGIAQNTVAQHLASVRRKYGVRSTAAAAALARGHGLV